MFHTEFIAIACASIEVEKRWWVETFDCRQAPLPDWDDPCPSDIALKLPGDQEPTILLRARSEAGGHLQERHPMLFCRNVRKAIEYFAKRGIPASELRDGGGVDYFEVRDPEGNVIEICEEP